LSHDFCSVPAAAGAAMGSHEPTKNGDFCVAPMEKKRILFREDAAAESNVSRDRMLTSARSRLGQKVGKQP
jgi:hypothetical protein